MAVRDRVVIMLLFDQIVREKHVEQAWAMKKQSHPHDSLWRVLTLLPDVDEELVYAEAARVYGFEEAQISRLTAVPLIQKMERQLKEDTWNRMVELRVIPISSEEQQHSHRQRLVFATHDPTRPKIHRFLQQLNLSGFDLRYAPESKVIDLLIKAFPKRYPSLQSTNEDDSVLNLGPFKPKQMDDAAPNGSSAGQHGNNGSAQNVKLRGNAFENILVETVRRGASNVCIVSNTQRQIEIYSQDNGQIEQWEVDETIRPNVLINTIRKNVLRTDFDETDTSQQRVVQRWIDDHLYLFRVSWLPATDDLPSESIVIRVLN